MVKVGGLHDRKSNDKGFRSGRADQDILLPSAVWRRVVEEIVLFRALVLLKAILDNVNLIPDVVDFTQGNAVCAYHPGENCVSGLRRLLKDANDLVVMIVNAPELPRMPISCSQLRRHFLPILRTSPL